MWLALCALVVAAGGEGAPLPEDDHRWSFAAVPTATFNTDEGFGTGGVVSLYHHHEGVLPYRDEVRINFFISSKLVQAHAITWDALRPFGIAGRSYLRLGYYSTVSQNYCGLGNVVDCAAGDAGEAAEHGGLQDDPARADDAYDAFVRRYHLMRFIRPYSTVIFRPWLRDKPYRTELLLGWRGSYTYPGDVTTPGPWPGSLYAQQFPEGEAGFSSVPFAGVVVDDRDDEVFPTRGFVAEASVRGGGPFTGSTWTYGGGTAIAAFFFAVSRTPRIVLATRGIADVLIGDPSTEELARIGGSLDPIAFGGSSIGRGIREHRYLGKLKLIEQTELRAQFVDVTLLEQDLSFGAALFSDAAMISKDVVDVGGDPFRPLLTFGVSFRILWNRTFAVRWDLATSPSESEGPGFYIIVGQAF
ncbi:MAG: BamA/TamA family outer membrane protein [Deltaproteobacteria bacterium]|nr:BamA/TamA family outer membrane protein [Deltaproteobacteria bacterium]